MQLPSGGPKYFPLLGHLPAMSLDPLKFFSQLPPRYGGVVPLRYTISRPSAETATSATGES